MQFRLIHGSLRAIRHRKHFAELEENYQKGRNRWDELNK